MSVEDVHLRSDVPSEPSARFACHLDGPVAVVTMNYRPYNVINRVVADEQLDQAAATLARELAAGPTIAHAATKALGGPMGSHPHRARRRRRTDHRARAALAFHQRRQAK